MEYVITTDNLTKKYGKHTAVKNVNLHIKRGEIYGFIGRNGAGKTTCMKMITGLANPTSGSFSLFGKNYEESKQLTSRIGSLIEEPGLYNNMTAFENLKCKAILLGIHNDKYINELIELVNLGHAHDKIAKQFSLGMKQRLGIALALIGEPDILVLDEPINGLDPQGIAEVRQTLFNLKKEKNLTIMISSHILEELSKIADSYGIIHNGEILEELSHDELLFKCQSHVEIHTDDPRKVCVSLESMGINSIKVNENNIVSFFDQIDNTIAINRQLIENGCNIIESKIITAELEQYYLDITNNNVGGEQNA